MVVQLRNGLLMPVIGFGTYPMEENTLARSLNLSHKIGYRRFDTAWSYKNEEILGQFIQQGHIDRKEIFITTKVHFNNIYKADNGQVRKVSTVAEQFELCCKRLHTDYIDLLLIHWPWFNSAEMWREMEVLYKQGRVRAIGVSSFEPSHLSDLMNCCEIHPMVNQFEVSPYNTRKYLIDFCNEHGIFSEAYSLFNVGKSFEGIPPILEDSVIGQIASKNMCTSAQVIIGWASAQGLAVSVRSTTEPHLQDDYDAIGIDLNIHDIQFINSLNKDHFVYAYKRSEADMVYIKKYSRKCLES